MQAGHKAVAGVFPIPAIRENFERLLKRQGKLAQAAPDEHPALSLTAWPFGSRGIGYVEQLARTSGRASVFWHQLAGAGVGGVVSVDAGADASPAGSLGPGMNVITPMISTTMTTSPMIILRFIRNPPASHVEASPNQRAALKFRGVCYFSSGGVQFTGLVVWKPGCSWQG